MSKAPARAIALALMTASAIACAGVFQTSEAGYEKTPILFVHGRGLSAQSFVSMIRYFERGGYPRSYLRAIELYPKDAPNIGSAETQIAPFVEKYLEEVNAEIGRLGRKIPAKTRVDIVAHSMGSVSSRWYIAKIRPDRVRAWVSLAGPNHGSDPNCPGLPNSGKREQCPAFATSPEQSYVQFALNGAPGSDVDETPYGIGPDSAHKKRIPPDEQRHVLYVTLRTETDEFVRPVSSTIVDGAGGVDFRALRNLPVLETSPGNFLTRRPVGHDDMLYTEYVMDFVYRIVSGPNP
jgi:pimeloyl-ACP methyl ester carboxylesterase